MDVAGEALRFSDLRLSDAVLRGLADGGFERPSPIQAKAIPLGLLGLDLIAQAKSGTGKTIAFVTLALHAAPARTAAPGPHALLVAPTRELALQSADVARRLAAHSAVRVEAFVGGAPRRADATAARRVDVACGTPGRLVALLLAETLVGAHVRLLVLDEADKLLEEGFGEQLAFLLAALPPRKQTLAFSATYPDELLQALRKTMRSPLVLSLLPPAAAAAEDERDPLRLLETPRLLGASPSSSSSPSSPSSPFASSAPPSAEGADSLVGGAALVAVRQLYQLVDGGTRRKGEEAARLLDEISFHQALVFCNQHEEAHELAGRLVACGMPAAFISGAHSHDERCELMLRMRRFDLRVLVTTDLLARGVDLGRLTLVLHLSPPRDLQTYLHRVGRTGRFGTAGVSILLLSHKELPKVEALLAPMRANVHPLSCAPSLFTPLPPPLPPLNGEDQQQQHALAHPPPRPHSAEERRGPRRLSPQMLEEARARGRARAFARARAKVRDGIPLTNPSVHAS